MKRRFTHLKKIGAARAAGDISVYDGLDYRGRIVQRAGQWQAYDAGDRRLGGFKSHREAGRAIYQASQSIAVKASRKAAA